MRYEYYIHKQKKKNRGLINTQKWIFNIQNFAYQEVSNPYEIDPLFKNHNAKADISEDAKNYYEFTDPEDTITTDAVYMIKSMVNSFRITFENESGDQISATFSITNNTAAAYQGCIAEINTLYSATSTVYTIDGFSVEFVYTSSGRTFRSGYIWFDNNATLKANRGSTIKVYLEQIL